MEPIIEEAVSFSLNNYILTNSRPWRIPLSFFSCYDYHFYLFGKLNGEGLTDREAIYYSYFSYCLNFPQDEDTAYRLLENARNNDLPSCFLSSVYAIKDIFPYNLDRNKANINLIYCLNHGYEEARFPLAITYFRGIGVKRNLDVAERLFSACPDSISRNRYLGLILVCNSKHDQFKTNIGLELLMKNEDDKDPLSCYYLGKIFMSSRRVKVNYEEAFSHFSAGIDAGSLLCIKEAGMMAYNGIGVKKDELLALSYFLRLRREPQFLYLSALIIDRYPHLDQDLKISLLKTAHELNYLPASLTYGSYLLKTKDDISILDNLSMSCYKASEILYKYYRKKRLIKSYHLYQKRMKAIVSKKDKDNLK